MNSWLFWVLIVIDMVFKIMDLFAIQGVQAVRPSVLEDTFNNIGEGFQEILETMNHINTSGQAMRVQDTLALQQAVFHYSLYQETVTKIASKSANAINEVMKAQ